MHKPRQRISMHTKIIHVRQLQVSDTRYHLFILFYSTCLEIVTMVATKTLTTAVRTKVPRELTLTMPFLFRIDVGV